jgi:hypothetical protein
MDRERRISWLLFGTLLVAYAYFFYPGGNANVNVRVALVQAFALEGRPQIDHFIAPNNLDLAEYEGHYYCDKAIGVSLAGVPV